MLFMCQLRKPHISPITNVAVDTSQSLYTKLGFGVAIQNAPPVAQSATRSYSSYSSYVYCKDHSQANKKTQENNIKQRDEFS